MIMGLFTPPPANMLVLMKMKIALLIAVLALSGCGSTRKKVSPVAVSPVAKFEGREVCIIENPRVRGNFLEVYKKALVDKGYEVRVLPTSAQLSACPITSQYVALWIYGTQLIHADIKVYHKTQPAGRAVYNGNQSLDAEETVQEMVNRLFAD